MQTGVTMKFDGFFSWGILKVMGVFSEEVHVLLDSCLKKRKKKSDARRDSSLQKQLSVLIVAAPAAKEKNKSCWRGNSSHLNFDVCRKPDESHLKMPASP